MATGWPMKVSYANGDVFSASDVNDITGTMNLLGSSVAYTAGKNKIINGDFGIWQRGTTFTSIASNAYSADRWVVSKDKTATITQQTFTPGTAPVSGYEGTYYFRQVISGGSYYALIQKIEDVRQLAGQTVTLSYWAKADASVTNTAGYAQNFGSGGSSQVSGYASNNTITTSWQRFTATFSIPSISGKTIGTSSFFGIQPILIQNATTHTIDIWGMQLEVGSTATAFQTATGTIQGELAVCQRYYEKSILQGSTPGGTNTGEMWFPNATIANGETWQLVRFSVTKRTSPTVTTYSYSGTSGRAANDSGTNYGADSANVWRNGDSYAVIKNNSGSSLTVTSVRWVYCNWVADAEF